MQLSQTQGQLSSSKAFVFLIPVGMIVGVLVLFIFVIPTSYSHIVSRFEAYKNDKKTEGILSQKLAVLQSVPPEILTKTSQTVAALPEKNPVLLVSSQIKEIATSHEAVVSEVKTGQISEGGNNVNQIELIVGIDAESFETLIQVAEEVRKRSPVANLSSVEMQGEESTKHGVFHLLTYWSQLPEALPAVTDPLSPLSPEETALVNQISSLTPPQFTILTPQTNEVRENPFN